MKRTKIICTLGPSTDNIETLTSLINQGMDVARLNFSHGNRAERDARIELIKEARKATGKDIPILLDTKGIKIRTGYVQGYSEESKRATMTLKDGGEVVFVCESGACKADGKLSTPERIYIDYDALPSRIAPGQRILLDDGLVATKVTGITGNEITAQVINGGSIVSRRSVNLPGVRIDIPALTAQDKEDILYGISKDVDFVALSFVKGMDDVAEARKFLDENGGRHIMIISKIENQQGVENIDEILALSDGLMVARGDMAVEIPFERVPVVQKEMIAKALKARKIVITATQMLHSMMKEPTPTRAEVSDIFNATQDSTTCVMLSGETANGDYPRQAVQVMRTVVEESEGICGYDVKFFSRPFESFGHVTTSICHAAISTAYNVRAKMIIAYSESGLTAKRLSSLRPGIPIYALSDNPRVLRQCHMLWGVQPVYQQKLEIVEDLYTTALRIAQERGLEDGDNIVVLAGTSVGLSGSTNALRVMTKGDVVLRGVPMSDARISGPARICNDATDLEKLKHGEIAVLYRLSPDVEPYLSQAAGILLAGNEYDGKTLAKAKLHGMPIIIDVQGVKDRIKDGMVLELIGSKGVVLRREKV